MNITVHCPIQPVSLLILMRQFRIQSECQYYNQPRQAAANGAASDIDWALMAESRSALHYQGINGGNVEVETHPSELGNTELLTKLEHCPKTASMAIPAPFLESPPWLFSNQVIFRQSAGKMPQVASHIPRYRTPVLDSSCTAAIIRYPTIPTVAESAITSPLPPHRSEITAAVMQSRNEAKYGGAERPCALIDVYPMSLRMVGRKLDSAAKEKLQQKWMDVCTKFL